MTRKKIEERIKSEIDVKDPEKDPVGPYEGNKIDLLFFFSSLL